MRSYFIVDSSCRIGEMSIEIASRRSRVQRKKKPGLGDRASLCMKYLTASAVD
jgi:hypothetical protein